MPLIAEHDPLRWLLARSSPGPRLPSADPGARERDEALPPETPPAETLPAKTPPAEALSADVLSAVVSDGLAAGRRQWQAAPGGPPELTACVSALTVPGLPPGLYQWADGFRLLDGQLDPELARGHGPASALVLVCANIRTACESHGTSGYGQALVRAGAIGHHVLLAAARYGIRGRACRQSCHPLVRALERSRGDMWRHLLTVAL